MNKFRWTLSATTSRAFIAILCAVSGLLVLLYAKPFLVTHFSNSPSAQNPSQNILHSDGEVEGDAGDDLHSTDVPSSSKGVIGVHVSGEVVHPGLYFLERGSRINNAIVAAGGFTQLSDQNSINLAASLRDGQKIVVLSKDASSPLVNINTADIYRLQTIKGIGKVTAEKIIEWRNKYGPFKKIEDLKKVPGIGDKFIKSIKGKVLL